MTERSKSICGVYTITDSRGRKRVARPPDALNRSAATSERLGAHAKGNPSGAVSDDVAPVINLPPIAPLGRIWAYPSLSVGYPLLDQRSVQFILFGNLADDDQWPVLTGVGL